MKIFLGGATEKRPRISKKYRKKHYLPLPGEGPNGKKDRKITKGRKIALLSLYYICTMFENPRGATAPPVPRCRRP